MKNPRAFHIAILIALAIAAFFRVNAQDLNARSVQGTVYDAQERTLPSAIIYLHNLRTQRVRTYISSRKGRYHFSGLTPYDDYEVYAEFDGSSSDSKTISGSDSQRDLVIDLKVYRRKR
jgi:Carboxypeptidase regulatory-like domain